MQNQRKNIPALRFAEFTNKWEQTQFGKLVDDIVGGGTPSREMPDYYQGNIPWVTVKDLSEDNFKDSTIEHISERGLKNSAAKLIPQNRFIISTRMGLGRGFINLVPMAINQDMKAIIPASNTDIIFLMQWYKKEAKQIERLGYGSTVKGIDLKTLKSIELNIPSKPEQQKIASFLTAVDDKIQQLQKKKDLLEQYKKGMMQKLFNSEIRFKDEDGNDFPDWEEKRLDHFAPLQRGFDLPMSNIKAGQYPVVFSNGILKKHSEFKVKGPGVVTGRSGTIGELAYVEQDFWPHNTTLWVTDFIDSLPKFVYYFYLNMKLDRFSTGSTVPTLNRNDIHSQLNFIPCFKEQMKIASFLTGIDGKITALKTQIQQTQEFKKGLLQQMFV